MSAPRPYSTKMMENVLHQLESEVELQRRLEKSAFQDVGPRLNFNPKKQIAKNLPTIQVTDDDIPQPPQKLYKLDPNTGRRRQEDLKNIPEVEFHLNYEPERLEAKEFVIPADFGRDYMSDQLIDLAYQFSRLSVPSNYC